MPASILWVFFECVSSHPYDHDRKDNYMLSLLEVATNVLISLVKLAVEVNATSVVP